LWYPSQHLVRQNPFPRSQFGSRRRFPRAASQRQTVVRLAKARPPGPTRQSAQSPRSTKPSFSSQHFQHLHFAAPIGAVTAAHARVSLKKWDSANSGRDTSRPVAATLVALRSHGRKLSIACPPGGTPPPRTACGSATLSMRPDHAPFALRVLGIRGMAVAFHQPVTHLEHTNLLRRADMRRRLQAAC
jgi:hypothetical protein